MAARISIGEISMSSPLLNDLKQWIDDRTDAERRYDALKDGSAYVKPQPAGEDEEIAIAREVDRLLEARRDDPDTIIALTERIEAHHDQRNRRRGRATDAAWSAIIDVLVNAQPQQRTTPAEDALIIQILLELDGGE
jgi:hypothetical protein